ncbi:carotenoid oxygenase family protein [Rhodococcus sp. MEB064]|uniref:carotenoid oxygenase family protein n=1 Tax=Rhodococcus sp. MEB064 TaxID=1587522 RepID=UPI0018CFC608|nr:carotenoid oxygenase family protein [Rhodococcus sp. MEB064]
MTQTSTPLYLLGPLEPARAETDTRELDVIGALPPELSGMYVRNGPNAHPGEDPGHAWAGHGMVHGIRVEAGRATWYRSRWVDTTPAPAGYDFFAPGRDRSVTAANTSIVPYAGRLLALQEAGLPYEVDRELNTVGVFDFDGRLTTGMTAHPKFDARAGELHFFDSYLPEQPHLVHHVASAEGELLRSTAIELPEVPLMHDFALTEHYVIFYDLPVVADPAIANAMPFRWSDDHEPRIGVMPRNGVGADTIWITVDPCWVIHTANAREDSQGRIVVEGNRVVPDRWDISWARLGGSLDHVPGNLDTRNPLPEAHLHRWTLDLGTRTVREEALDDRAIEFPTIDLARAGLSHEHVYAVGYPRVGGADGYELIKYDTSTGTDQVRSFGTNQIPGEAYFVAAPDASADDEGWLFTLVSGVDGGASELMVLDASDFTGHPVARIVLPERIPYGFHGSWVPDQVRH